MNKTSCVVFSALQDFKKALLQFAVSEEQVCMHVAKGKGREEKRSHHCSLWGSLSFRPSDVVVERPLGLGGLPGGAVRKCNFEVKQHEDSANETKLVWDVAVRGRASKVQRGE
eukprot:4575817-Amphidinium_carterae.1